jgi:hypothetical protein
MLAATIDDHYEAGVFKTASSGEFVGDGER